MQLSSQVQQVVATLKQLSLELGNDNIEQLAAQFNDQLVILSQLIVSPDASLYEDAFRGIAIIVNEIKDSLVEIQNSHKEEFESRNNSMKNEAKYLRQA
jgi:hypothetical protein